MNQKGSALLILLVVMVGLLIVGGAYYYFHRPLSNPAMQTASGNPQSATFKEYSFTHAGFQVSIPTGLMPYETSNSVTHQVVFSVASGSTNPNIVLLIKIAALPQGETIMDAIEHAGIATSSVQQIEIGGQQYYTWNALEEDIETQNYFGLITPGTVVIAATYSTPYVTSSTMKTILGSLKLLSQ